jgi:hypothetical protein
MTIMKKRICILAAAMLCCGITAAEKNTVKISGRHILVNDAPYLIKGICYHPVPKGTKIRDFGNLTEDLTLMVEAGVNTIRVYSPIDDKAVLDEIHTAGFKLIIGIGYDQGGYFDIRSGSFIDYVNDYKDHPAVLMWELGNECNFHPEIFEADVGNWYAALNRAAEMIHQNDPSHPVTTAHGELPDDTARASCPNVDVWGMNVYRWDHPEDVFAEWAAVSPKPMYLAEAGADSYMTAAGLGYEQGPNQRAQADANGKILDAVFSHQDICSGVALFAFSDEWWKAGSPDTQDAGDEAAWSGGVPYDGAANEDYWGIVDVDGNRKLTFAVVKEKYNAFPNEKAVSESPVKQNASE